MKPKYEIGQAVWVSDCGEPTEVIINAIIIRKNSIVYDFNSINHCNEVYVYTTREALIDSEIAYWTELKNET